LLKALKVFSRWRPFECAKKLTGFRFENTCTSNFVCFALQVEILSHHGAEHYCPISIFKVFGISEIDLISGTDKFVSRA
jgi:hypothetical protein